MITGDEIDIAAKKSLLGRFRAVAKFEADVEPVLLPNSRFVHHLPDRQMRMGAIESANVHGLILGHTLSLHLIPFQPVSSSSWPSPDGRRHVWYICFCMHSHVLVFSLRVLRTFCGELSVCST